MTPEAIARTLSCRKRGCTCGRRAGDGYKTHCPAHSDPNPSLHISEKNGKLLVKCFGGCEQGQVVAALKERNLWPSGNNDRHKPRVDANPKGRIVDFYDYRDEAGHLLFQVCRLEPKSFRQRRPDGQGGWVWGLTAGDYYRRPGEKDWFRVNRTPPPGAKVKHFPECPSILYRLPELLRADPAAPVFIVEGEADADALASLGFVATSNPGGAGKWREEFNEFFRDRRVVILPDNDEPGRKHARQVAQNLHGIAGSVKLLEIPGLTPKGDAGDWLKAGGTKEQLLALADAAPEWASPSEPETTLGGYVVEQGRICQLKEVRVEGGGTITMPVPLCNFVARCEEEVFRDNGLEQTLEFHLAGTLDTGHSLPLARVKAAEFRGMGWVTRCWGMAATLVAGQAAQDRVREAIQRLSQGAKRRTIFTHTGWRKLNGVWTYLHGGGGINAPVPVEVDLGPELARYCLPEPGGAESARASLRFLDLGPWEVTAPLLACVYLAPLADLLEVDFTLWLLGQTGVFKSTVASLALSHFGDFDRKTLPGNWGSTGNSLERRAFTLKDSLFVIDDFAPPRNAQEAHDLEKKAHRVCRAAGNRAGRGRLQADLSERPTYDPRAMVVSTGEILPSGQSLLARIFTVEMQKGDGDSAKLTAAQAEKHLYPGAMSAYIVWLAPHLDETLAKARELWGILRQAAQTGVHAKVPEVVAWLAVGFRLLLDFHVEVGTIQADEALDLEERAWRTFTHLGSVHGRRIEKEKPSLRFLNILRELFVQRRVYVKSAAGGTPENWEELGWRVPGETDPGAEFLGWSEDGFLYLMPETAYRVVQEALRRQNNYLGVGKNALFRALAEEGLLEPAADGENTRQKKIGGQNQRVLFLRHEALSLTGNGFGSGR